MDAIMNSAQTTFSTLTDNVGVIALAVMGIAAGLGIFYFVKGKLRRLG